MDNIVFCFCFIQNLKFDYQINNKLPCKIGVYLSKHFFLWLFPIYKNKKNIGQEINERDRKIFNFIFLVVQLIPNGISVLFFLFSSSFKFWRYIIWHHLYFTSLSSYMDHKCTWPKLKYETLMRINVKKKLSKIIWKNKFSNIILIWNRNRKIAFLHSPNGFNIHSLKNEWKGRLNMIAL